jgi:predicted RNA-binding Zn-ribbon protein involved in translation (DUF1610 family)
LIRLPPENTDHEHRWVLTGIEDYLGGGARHTYRCESCGLKVSKEFPPYPVSAPLQPNRYAPDAFLHTCKNCGRRYRDDDPFSVFCSPDCREQAGEDARRTELKRLIVQSEHLASQGQSQSERADARRFLEKIASNEIDESLRLLAKQALERLKVGS